MIDSVVFKSNKDQSYDFVVVLDKNYNYKTREIFLRFISSIVDADILVLNCFNFNLDKEPNKIIDFYADRCIDLKQYIKPKSKIITVGRALYSIIKSDDLDIKGFYDIIFNKTYFYAPDLDSIIFPIDNLYNFINPRKNKILDNWSYIFAKHQIRNAFMIEFPKIEKQRIKKEVIEDPNVWLQANKDKACKMACDIETKLLDPWHPDSEILEVTISFDGITGYLLDWKKVDIYLFSEFIKNKMLIMQNGKYDTKFFILKGVPRENINIYHDTWNASHVINEMQRSSLKSDAWLYTIHGGYDRELDLYKKKYPECKNDYSRIPEEVRYPYAIMDAIVTYQIYEQQVKEIERIDRAFPVQEKFPESQWSLKKYFYDIVMPAVNVFLDIELEGMCVDWNLLEKYSLELEKLISEKKDEIIKSLKVDFDLDSGNELGAVLEMLGWKDYGRSKEKPKPGLIKKLNADLKINNIYLTGDDQLIQWINDGHKEAKLIQEYRALKTLMNTFVGKREDNSGFFQYRKRDDRIHPTFGPFLTSSHRNWSQNPNGQNIPKHGERAKWYRRIFIPPSEDYVIDEKDASGFQLRIGAIYSQDKEMKKVFTELGGDMHSMTAQFVLRRDLSLEEFIKLKKAGDDNIKEIRFKAKGINFQLEFGATAFNFAKTVIEKEWGERDVIKYINDFNLQNKVDKMLSLLNDDKSDMFKSISNKSYFAKCWAVASDIRGKYFEKYSGLKSWIDKIVGTNEIKGQAEIDGYVRSPFGAIRRLPQLKYQGKDDRKGVIKNLKNIALNSPVQSYENAIMILMAIKLNKYIKENNLKSRLCGNVHDAIVGYTHREEVNELFKVAKEEFEKDRPENKGIPLELEINIADYYDKNQVWGFGDELI